jgi:hypothetical protein
MHLKTVRPEEISRSDSPVAPLGLPIDCFDFALYMWPLPGFWE